MSKLPVKIQIGIRDYWTDTSAPVQKAINTLKTTLGVRVNVNPEWSLLLSELETFYPDKATFVPSVARTVEAFCTALTAVADNDGGDDDKGNEEFGDELIDKIEGTVWIHVEVSKNREISLEWSPQQKGFIIKLAKAPSPSPSYIQSLFAGALASPSFFSPKKAAIPNTGTATTASPSANTSAEGGGDDWADVSFDNATGKAAVVEVPHRHAGRAMRAVAPAAAIAQFDMIPDVSTISRPDDLLLKPPYHLIVKAHSQSSIEVECSHSPTLQFLSDYLQKWCRTNHNRTDTPPEAKMQLHQSAFGLGVVYDRLTITSEQRYFVKGVTPTMVLALVEGVLGYKSVASFTSSWAFRRDIEFKNS